MNEFEMLWVEILVDMLSCEEYSEITPESCKSLAERYDRFMPQVDILYSYLRRSELHVSLIAAACNVALGNVNWETVALAVKKEITNYEK